MKLRAKLIACNVPSSNPAATQSFYSALLGVDFARSLTEQTTSFHIPLTEDGQFLWLSDRTAKEEQITCVFAVDDLDHAMNELSRAGGSRFIGPFDTPIAPKLMSFYERQVPSGVKVTPTLGRCALMRDPDGNTIALMQLEQHAQVFYKAGEYDRGLSEYTMRVHEKVREAATALEK
jgi:predicted enzyme related to lactoylglutathione lyase